MKQIMFVVVLRLKIGGREENLFGINYDGNYGDYTHAKNKFNCHHFEEPKTNMGFGRFSVGQRSSDRQCAN